MCVRSLFLFAALPLAAARGSLWLPVSAGSPKFTVSADMGGVPGGLVAPLIGWRLMWYPDAGRKAGREFHVKT